MNIALIEFGTSHDECLYSQVKFLSKANHNVFLCCLPELYERVKDYDGVTQFIYHDFGSFKLLKRENSFLAFARQLKSLGVEGIVFNTAYGKDVLKFLFVARFFNFRYAGLLHNVDKLKSSATQRLISTQIKKYFVLNSYISSSFSNNLSSFYPIFFPRMKMLPVEKPENEIWVCIPGQVEFKRRSYEDMFNALRKSKLPENIRLIFLGRCMHKHGDGDKVKKIIAELGIADQCLLFDNFVPLNVFYTYMSLSDYVLPLIHPYRSHTKGYDSTKVSGAFNVAFGFKKIMFCDEHYSKNEDFADSSVFYNPAEMHTVFERIKEIDKSRFYTSNFWKEETHQQKFLQFLFSGKKKKKKE